MSSTKKIAAVDLFCGAGGLTHGLIKAGIDVRVGIDLDPACHYPIEKNNNTRFIKADVSQLTPLEILSIFKNSEINLMAGCAPCNHFHHIHVPLNNIKRIKTGVFFPPSQT